MAAAEEQAMRFWQLLRRSAEKFIVDDCPTQAAAIAFYTLFSLPPLLAIIVWISGWALKPEDVQGTLERQITELTGAAGAQQIKALLENAQQSPPGLWGRIVGFGFLFFGASGVIGQLQFALNRIWNRPKEPHPVGIVLSVVIQRLISIAIVLGVGLVMLAALLLSTLLSTVSQRLGDIASAEWLDKLLWAANAALSILVITVIFAALFRYLTAFRIKRRQAILGGVVSATLFTMGNTVLGWYLSLQDVGSAYGSAGSLAVLLVWVYYSTMIFLFGAELTNQAGKKNVTPAGSQPKKPS
jgi:membrane protein